MLPCHLVTRQGLALGRQHCLRMHHACALHFSKSADCFWARADAGILCMVPVSSTPPSASCVVHTLHTSPCETLHQIKFLITKTVVTFLHARLCIVTVECHSVCLLHPRGAGPRDDTPGDCTDSKIASVQCAEGEEAVCAALSQLIMVSQ